MKNRISYWRSLSAIRRILCFMLSLTMVVLCFPHYSLSVSAEDDYISIYTPVDLWQIRYNMDKNYILMNDLDLSAAMSEGGLFYQVWTPLGEQSNVNTTPFEGVFDGNGHSISGWSGQNFIAINSGTVKNLTIKDSNGAYGICGTNNGTIENCQKYGSISGRSESNLYVGGICSKNSGIILSCSVNGTVEGVGGYYNNDRYEVVVGGIAGENYGTIRYSYNTASVTGYSRSAAYGSAVGGICGRNNGGIIEDSYNRGNVLSCNSWSTTSSTNDKTLYAYAGGLVARNKSSSSSNIARCYNVGTVEAKYTFANPYRAYTYVGALTAEDNLYKISYCYYINDMYPCSNEHASNPGNNAHLTSGLMQIPSSFQTFDFTWIWDMGTGGYLYPVIRKPLPKYIHVPEEPPTCLTNGRAEYWYNKEGKIFADENGTIPTTLEALTLPALGHDYSSVITEPSCTEDGSITYTCNRCGYSYVDVIDALGHSWSEWVQTTSPTCTTPGMEERICSRCNAEETQEVDALGHDYDAVIVEPTCTTGGYTRHTCSRCGDSYVDSVVGALGHSWSEWVYTTTPTCTKSGMEKRTCSRCNAEETREVEALGHDYSAVVTPPTCLTDGYTTYVCTRCGDSYVDNFVDALGHDYQEEVTSPTCTEQGFTTYICLRCGNTYVDNYTEALRHDYQEEVTPPTCTEQGYTTHTCNRCGDSYVDSRVAALGHDYSSAITEPTCIDEGYTTHTCTRCGNSYTDTPVNALGHDWDDGVVTQMPTTVNEGIRTFTCRRCGAIRTEPIEIIEFQNPFEDVRDENYFFTPVMWAVNHNPQITAGVDATHFGPNNDCTREQIVTFLWAANGKPEPATTGEAFSDVPKDAWYYKPVMWAVQHEITSGVSGGVFGVGQPCTRAQAMTFLWAAKGKPEPESTVSPFNDVSSGDWFCKPILWAAENGVTAGIGDGLFGVNNTCTRAQIITFLYKVYGAG